jgi:hypothetical protein
MYLSKPGLGLLVLFSAFIAAGCGELDTILSSNLSTNSAVYRVNATVEGRNLDECAIVGIGSRIRPYFLDPIESDRDITGLVVFLETPRGELVSRKVRYIPGFADRSSEQSLETNTGVDGQILEDDAPESTKTAAELTGSGEISSGGTGLGTDAENLGAESGEGRGYGTQAASDGSSPNGNSPQDRGEANGNGSSGSDDGREKETVYQIREKKTFSEPEESANPDELVVYVSNLGEDLPALLFPEKLAIGPYILVFQVMGLQDVLSRFEKLIYYISDAELSLGDIQTYHSGDAERSGVVSPDSVLMLETKVSADARLEPYIVWYHGKNRLKEGPVSEGVDRLLWRAPANTGFQALRAEVFPFRPSPAYKNTSGLAKELSLAISSKQVRRIARNTGASQPDPSIVRWYQLGGDLFDSLAPLDSKRELTPGDDTIITWLPKTGVYGLAAGSAYSYTIPGPLFTPNAELPGRGQFVFRFAVQSSGIISSGIFALARTSQTLKLELSCDTDANRLILSCVLGDEKQEQGLALPFSARDEWITVVIDFTVYNKEFRAELSLLSTGNGDFPSELASLSDKDVPAGKSILLPGTLTGEGTFRIGAAAVPVNPFASRASIFGGSAAGKSSADTAVPAKSSTDITAALSAESTPDSLPPGEENRDIALLTATVPALTGAGTETSFGTGAPAPTLILDAAAVLFRVIEVYALEVVEADGAGEPADETGKAKTASENTVQPENVSPERPVEQAKLSVEKSAAAPKTGSDRQPSVPAITGTEKTAGQGSAGKESSQTPNPGNGGASGSQTPNPGRGNGASGNPAGKEAAPAITGEEADLPKKTGDDDPAPDTLATETLSLSASKL